nr:MAG TPA: hypothetical protein [Caudoviricetes sp.]
MLLWLSCQHLQGFLCSLNINSQLVCYNTCQGIIQ